MKPSCPRAICAMYSHKHFDTTSSPNPFYIDPPPHKPTTTIRSSWYKRQWKFARTECKRNVVLSGDEAGFAAKVLQHAAPGFWEHTYVVSYHDIAHDGRLQHHVSLHYMRATLFSYCNSRTGATYGKRLATCSAGICKNVARNGRSRELQEGAARGNVGRNGQHLAPAAVQSMCQCRAGLGGRGAHPPTRVVVQSIRVSRREKTRASI